MCQAGCWPSNYSVAGYDVKPGPNFDILKTDRAEVFMWCHGVPFEEQAVQQLANLATMPFVRHHVAAMPDTHWGMGATVGTVYVSNGAVIPAAVGVDIGCGMIAARLNLMRDNVSDVEGHLLRNIRAEIERRVPMGRTNNGREGDRGAWHNIPESVNYIWDVQLFLDYQRILERHPGIRPQRNPATHLGTLGTGNHFIELQYDEHDGLWIMLHSGSRGIGNKIGTYFTNQAKELMQQFFISLPDPDLAYIPQAHPLYADYMFALNWAQKFALHNRELMLGAVVIAVQEVLGRDIQIMERYNTHHNYAATEDHFGKKVLVTRKGAIRAGAGEIGIIPGSMGSNSYIVRGKGNPLSYHSCSHGAGRAMSRARAVKTIALDDHVMATLGVECDKSVATLDETPAAYKSINAVIEAEKDLVDVVHTMKQLVCCKGIGE